MAIIIPSLGSIRGKLGGLVFNGGRFGNVVKLKGQPSISQTARQAAKGSVLTRVEYQWSLLNMGQRAAWNDYAAVNDYYSIYGNPRKVFGVNYFVGLNCRRVIQGHSILTAPPVYSVVPAHPAINAYATAGCWWLDALTTWDSSLYRMLVYASPLQSYMARSARPVMGYLRNRLVYQVGGWSQCESWSSRYGSDYSDFVPIGRVYITVGCCLYANASGLVSPLVYKTFDCSALL